MTPDKAIKILTMATGKGGIATNDDYITAQKLGIEALKRYKECKSLPAYAILEPLPGETED